MTREQQKHLLLLQCAGDRLELALAHRTTTPSPMRRAVRLATDGPWLDIASAALGPLLPRRARLLLVVWRMWRARQRG